MLSSYTEENIGVVLEEMVSEFKFKHNMYMIPWASSTTVKKACCLCGCDSLNCYAHLPNMNISNTFNSKSGLLAAHTVREKAKAIFSLVNKCYKSQQQLAPGRKELEQNSN